jgi:hypothetical protein
LQGFPEVSVSKPLVDKGFFTFHPSSNLRNPKRRKDFLDLAFRVHRESVMSVTFLLEKNFKKF